jgi:hypothetical protein
MVRTEYDSQYSSTNIDTRLFGKYQDFYEEMQGEFIDVEREDLLPNLKTLVEYLLVFSGEGISRNNEGYRAYSNYINLLQTMWVRERCPDNLVERLFNETLEYAEYHQRTRLATKKTKFHVSFIGFKEWFGI